MISLRTEEGAARRGVDALAHILLPNKCMFCGEPLDCQQRICNSCDKLKPLVPHGFPLPADAGLDGLAVPFWYELGVDHAIHDLKFAGNCLNARKLAIYMAGAVREEDWLRRIDRLVPVPMHWADQLERGYNQSVELGKWCASHLALPLCTDALKKIRATQPQHCLSARERQQNLRGAFRAEPSRVTGRTILLIDDVLTTGSTLAECAAVLRAAGAAAVYGLVAARTRLKVPLEEWDPEEMLPDFIVANPD